MEYELSGHIKVSSRVAPQEYFSCPGSFVGTGVFVFAPTSAEDQTAERLSKKQSKRRDSYEQHRKDPVQNLPR